MRRICLGLYLMVLVGALPGFAGAQSDQLTGEEQRAVLDVRERFSKRISEAVGLETLVPGMFVPDFVARWVKEAKAERQTDGKDLPRAFATGMTYAPKLLDEGDEKDWRELHVATFDLMRVAEIAVMNQIAKGVLSHKPPEESELDAAFDVAFPASVKKLLAEDPVLTNFIELHTRTVPITTAADLARVAKTLRQAVELIKKDRGGAGTRFSPDAMKMMDQAFSKAGGELGPWLTVADRETFGFPKGTRLITFFASGTERLTIVKVGTEFKIVEAAVSSPD